ncbi:MAG TPA: diaminopimelate decarboxylase [Clostridiales bacterium]|jgi:diaminopimelate decarboxylase|nr:diaminopimelate decarboxylase [Clostridiales bacterium]
MEGSVPNYTLSDDIFEAAARRFPTPFYLYDERGIRQAAQAVQAAFAWNKGFHQYYAVKALPTPAILKLMLDEGCGLDCSSMTELLLAQKVGAKGADIMFSANAMPAEELRFAQELDATINLDDISDVDRLIDHGGVPDMICLRVNPGKFGAQRKSVMGSSLDAKFGMLPTQLLPALEQLKAHGATAFGLHAMTDSNALDISYYINNARYLFELGAGLEKQSGLKLALINLSGGIGIPYRPEDKPADLAAISSGIIQEYERVFTGRDDVRLVTELGRYITGPSGWLVARAIHKKAIWRDYVGLDASAADLIRPAMYGAYHHISVVGKRNAPHDRVYDVTGALCENNDKFAIQRSLPQIDIGDILLLHDAGAHAHAMGYQYNGRLRSAEVLYTTDGEFKLIRRAETPEDYFQTMVFD